MAQSINLIPQEEKKEQAKVKIVKASTVFSIIILVVVGFISAYLFYRTSVLEKEIAAYDANIESTRADIRSMADIEIVARNLDKKYSAITQLFGGRVDYSMLAEELRRRTPDSVSIQDFTLSKNTVSISGVGSSYISISKLLSNLTEPYPEITVSGLEGLFTNVSLNSVGLDSREGNVKFSITITYNSELLKR